MKKFVLTAVLGFFAFSIFAQTQFDVSFKELPKDVQKYVTKNYAGYDIAKAVQGQSKKGKTTFYDVTVTKGAEQIKLTFDSDEDFVKKEAVTATAPASAPVSAPVVAPVPAVVTPAPVVPTPAPAAPVAPPAPPAPPK